MQLKAASIILCCALAACSSTGPSSSSSGPPGAPEPTSPDQELVDQAGCRWWVVADKSGMRWEKIPGFRPDCDEAKKSEPRTIAAEPKADGDVKIEDIDVEKADVVPAPDAENGTDASEKTEPESTETPTAEPELYIQAATFRSEANAAETEDKIRKLGYPLRSRDGNTTTFHKVIVGPFSSKEERIKALNKLRRSGFPDAYLLVL